MQACDNPSMSWVLYLFGSGQALFLGAALILAAVAAMPKVSGWKNATLAMVARIGLVIVVLSAAPLSYWLYAVALGVTTVWLWRERRRDAARRGRESIATTVSHHGRSQPQLTPDPLWWRRATALVWLGIIALELPHQFAPRLSALGNPPLWIIGDSVTAGLGSSEKTWPALLPAAVEVHNLAQPGSTTGMALARQANQLPADGGLVVIEIGGNDLLLEGGSARQFERDLDALLSWVCGSAGASPSQAGASPSRPDVSLPRTVVMFELPLPPLCNEYGRIQRRLAARHKVRLIPKRVLISVLAGGGATLDSIHLSEAGHQRMADEVWAVIGPAYR